VGRRGGEDEDDPGWGGGSVSDGGDEDDDVSGEEGDDVNRGGDDDDDESNLGTELARGSSSGLLLLPAFAVVPFAPVEPASMSTTTLGSGPLLPLSMLPSGKRPVPG